MVFFPRLRWIGSVVAGVALVVGVTACGSSGSSAKGHGTSTSTKADGVPSGTTDTTPPPVVKGRTPWQDATAEWKRLVPKPIAKSPEHVAEDLAAAWRGGDTSSVGEVTVVAVTRGEPLVIVLKETGGANPAVEQSDVEVTLEGGDAGWAVSTARRQDSCYRAIDRADPNRCA